MKKENVKYNRGDEIIEVVIRDNSGSKMQIWRNNINDSTANGNLLMCLVTKWGMKFNIKKGSFLDMDSEFLKF